MAEIAADPNSDSTVLEANQRLSRSRLWQLQRQFFQQQGIRAWSNGTVPHYITSNPFIANAFGKVVFGFLRDWYAIESDRQPASEPQNPAPDRQAPEIDLAPLDFSQPVYILELGAGSGRFAYHFLKQFFATYPQSVLRHLPVKYVMTDFVSQTLDFWQTHPRLQPFVEQGLLDFARFDIETPTPLQLVQSGETLTAETLKNPPIVLANYVFDSIPHDVFAVRDEQLYETLVTLTVPGSDVDLPPADLLERLQIAYADRPIVADYYDNPNLNLLLQTYQQQLTATHVLFPIAALNCLEQLRHWANDRLLLLSADKGDSQPASLKEQESPQIACHGSVSLSVNYHAIAQYVESQGGQALRPDYRPRSLQVCAFLFGQLDYRETRQAYGNTIQTTGPDDFFAIKKIVERHYADLSLKQILGYLRFSRWDAKIFLGCWPALMAQVEAAPEFLQQEVYRAIHQVWNMYYWIDESIDLPLQVSRLLARMGCFAEAIGYLGYSLQLAGETPEKWLHQAACCLHLKQVNEALAAVERALALQPMLEPALALKRDLETDSPAVDADLVLATIDSLFDDADDTQARTLESMANATSADPLTLNFSRLRQTLECCIEGNPPLPLATILQTEPATLSQLGVTFQLSTFERALLLLCLGVELEPNLRALCARIQGDGGKAYVTLGLALAVLPESDWSVLSPQSALHRWQLIRPEPGCVLTQAPLTLDRRILCYLLGKPALVPQLDDLITSLAAGIATALSPAYQAIVQQIVAAWTAVISSGQPLPLVCLVGTDASIDADVAVAACDALGLQLVVLPADALPANPHDLKQLQRHWEREAILSHCALLLDCETGSLANPERQTAIALFLETLSAPAILSSRDNRKPQLRRPLITFEVPPLPQPEAADLWRTCLGDAAAELDGYVDVLASQFKLNPTAIQTLCNQRLIQTPNSNLHTPDILRTQLWDLCRHQARPNLDDLAQRIEATATWDDLVLPDRQRTILKDIEIHLRMRSQVYQTWGFGQKGNRGLGISALFYGESGTGKTMAAEVLAQVCQLDLYRIDLSTVVSKYIGETEKNLRRIFDAAETGGVILLFDEADALFGKRTEVKDSHDRHANIEVSYLLQRMEAYQGLAILTTNLKNSLDKAFLRRLRFMLPFPLPDADARAQIWQRIFPIQTPQQHLDYDKLGQLKIAGGNIRNIALNAAFLAAATNEPVSMSHILQAAQREYLKLEKLLTNEEIEGWDLH